jgi:exopolysaccharide biosynthesis polyprenyl glycosylphosphotransferase
MSTELSPDHGVAAEVVSGDFEAEEVRARLTRLPRPDLTDDDPKGILERYRTKALRADALSALLAAAIAVVFRFGPIPPMLYVVLTILIPVLWISLVAIRHGYEYRFLSTGPEEYRRVASAGLLLFTVLAVASYTVQGDLSRLYVIVTAPGAVLLSLASRHLIRGWIYRLRVKGRGLQKVLVVGRADAAVTVIEKLDHEPQHGFVAVGACVPSSGHQPSHVHGVPVVGAPTQILQAVDEVQAHVVAVVSHPDLSGHALRRLSWSLEERQVELVVSPGIIEVAGPRLSIHPVAGLSLLHLERPAINGARMIAKNVFDKFVGGMSLFFAAPLLITIAIAVKVSSRGPILFRQTRIGIDGQEFTMVKFRSMVIDAEKRRSELMEHSEGNEMLFKMKRDPRVTAIGSVIRRFSLDELPQLWNVLRGDMSLVGPRPPLPEEVAAYSDDATRRLRVRPGLTGLWQVSGRSDLSWEESLRLDLRYVDNWSMALDMAILWRTGKAVIKGSGAY